MGKIRADLTYLAKKIIQKISYITIATVTPEGLPWNSPVHTSFDEHYNFYWASWIENIHSKNIETNNNVFLVIYDSTVPAGAGFGVYLKCKAYKLTDEKEITIALKYLYGREGKKSRLAKEFQGNYPRRVYKAVPSKVWVNTDGRVHSNYVDKRVEIQLI
ncbi:pyridoxamine 5'-phosphate oxidase family protein [Candidatus Roizmanbacteria bacterium]|nr:pyridoxamine 5'-phosphate oxidase family protein [Candidatus Roizmanbacteria bacterium]